MKVVTFLHCSFKLSFSPWGLFVMSIMSSTSVCFPCYVGLVSYADIFRSVAVFITPLLFVTDTELPVIPLQQSWIVHCVVVALLSVSWLATGDKMPVCPSVWVACGHFLWFVQDELCIVVEASTSVRISGRKSTAWRNSASECCRDLQIPHVD